MFLYYTKWIDPVYIFFYALSSLVTAIDIYPHIILYLVYYYSDSLIVKHTPTIACNYFLHIILCYIIVISDGLYVIVKRTHYYNSNTMQLFLYTFIILLLLFR
jgi:hypothetical protein